MVATPPKSDTYRPAFVPALLAASALLSGIALLGTEWFTVIRYIVAIMALIVAWFALQGGQWWWTVVFFVVAILWNPVFPIPDEGSWWIVAHIAGAVLFGIGGAAVRVTRPDAPTATPRARR